MACGHRPTRHVIDGAHATTLKGNYEELFAGFQKLLDDYVDLKFARR